MKLWNALDGQLLLVLRTGLPAVRAVAISNRHVVAVATSEGTIQFFEPGQNGPLVVFGHLSDIDCLCVNSTGTMLASGGQDGLIHIWDFVGYKKVTQYGGHTRRVMDSAVLSRFSVAAEHLRATSPPEFGNWKLT